MELNGTTPNLGPPGKMGSQRLVPGRHWEGRRARPQREALRPVCRRVAIATAGPCGAATREATHPAPRAGRPQRGAHARRWGGGGGQPRGGGAGGGQARNSAPGETWRPAGRPRRGGRGPRGKTARRLRRSPFARRPGWGKAPAGPASSPLRDRPRNPGSGTEKRPPVTRNESLLTVPSRYRGEAQRRFPGGARAAAAPWSPRGACGAGPERWKDDPAVGAARRPGAKGVALVADPRTIPREKF